MLFLYLSSFLLYLFKVLRSVVLGFKFQSNHPTSHLALRCRRLKCVTHVTCNFSRRNRDGAMAVQFGRCLPGIVTTFPLNTSDAEMTELKCIKPLAHHQHLDNKGIHFNLFYFQASCHVWAPDMHFVGADLTPSVITLRGVWQTTQNYQK